jgi:hypothetical protein
MLILLDSTSILTVGLQSLAALNTNSSEAEQVQVLRLDLFLLIGPLDRARSVLTDRAICSIAGHSTPVVWVFSTSGFHRFFATKPVSSETNEGERGQI